MHWRNPNKPEKLRDPRPYPKYRRSDTGNAPLDGYTVVSRRPRVASVLDPVDPDRADAIERAFGVGTDEADDIGY